MGASKVTRWIARRETRVEEIHAIAAAEQWERVAGARRAHLYGSWYSWKTPDGMRVTWVEEHTLGLRRVDVEGEASCIARLGALLPHYSRSDLLEIARGDRLPESLDGLRALAVLESEAPSPDLLMLMRRWMTHPHYAVRRAIWHLACFEFTELLPDVERLAEEDAELRVLWSGLRDALERRKDAG